MSEAAAAPTPIVAVAEGEEGRAPANDAVAVAAVLAAPPAPPPAAALEVPRPKPHEDRPRIYGKHSTQKRWTVDEHQRMKLEAAYSRCRFPSEKEREEIGREIGGTCRQVQVWFQNRRQRDANQESISRKMHPYGMHGRRGGGGMGAAPIAYVMPAMAPGMQVMQYGGPMPFTVMPVSQVPQVPQGVSGGVLYPGAEPMAAAQPGQPSPNDPAARFAAQQQAQAQAQQQQQQQQMMMMMPVMGDPSQMAAYGVMPAQQYVAVSMPGTDVSFHAGAAPPQMGGTFAVQPGAPGVGALPPGMVQQAGSAMAAAACGVVQPAPHAQPAPAAGSAGMVLAPGQGSQPTVTGANPPQPLMPPGLGMGMPSHDSSQGVQSVAGAPQGAPPGPTMEVTAEVVACGAPGQSGQITSAPFMPSIAADGSGVAPNGACSDASARGGGAAVPAQYGGFGAPNHDPSAQGDPNAAAMYGAMNGSEQLAAAQHAQPPHGFVMAPGPLGAQPPPAALGQASQHATQHATNGDAGQPPLSQEGQAMHLAPAPPQSWPVQTPPPGMYPAGALQQQQQQQLMQQQQQQQQLMQQQQQQGATQHSLIGNFAPAAL